MLLGRLLQRQGIDIVVLERKSRDYVLSRIRAGVLERGLVDLMRQAGVSVRMEKEGILHNGTILSHNNDEIRIDFEALAGTSVLVYGQTELTRDLYDAHATAGTKLIENVQDVVIHDVETEAPYVTYRGQDGLEHRIDCDFVAGCDGFHGVSRKTIPEAVRSEYEKVYPFGWLGVLSATPPVHEELIYATSDRGFALCSMRNPQLSRYYVQVPSSDQVENWTDQAFWDELKRRIPQHAADNLITGASIEKTIAPLRSFVSEPMRWGRLFLCGDAAHIVPPTGAKGLNTAASDVHYLYQGLIGHYLENDSKGLDEYSQTALARVWKAERFSWWMTNLLHHFPEQDGFDRKMQLAEFSFLAQNRDAQAVLATNYVGLPY